MSEIIDLKPVEIETSFQVRDKVYNRLREAILAGGLKPGERLVERKLADQLNVSRTPVREAVRMLELEGLVSHLPRVGAVVAQVNDLEVLEIYRIRAVLEGLAARMAAERINPEQLRELVELLNDIEKFAREVDLKRLESVHLEFNDLIYKSADSPRLYSMIMTLTDHISRCVRVGYCYPGRVAAATLEHRQLVEAIKLRDGDLAERIAREHIDNSRQAYFSEMAQKRQTEV
ncbi:transcriptional regulator, GntR family [Desulfofarcimen acetoxidans DSM 771]|uniref:Transcriptional regulator, GntR family n=1 Tax=Desulfofarcimen acetoxidans (strain ATCC 49208 / DSM 771 / KCTC 5769 / VKM B-1644 / 5575) TaxID=485916 RepID=C8W1P4_DESAS|nr:GntR family transcriptional regulator [Desulfofarcimen acetoxidans]ACV63515.1 transcriptional regulator, GntR family [Desulfofarcimen acetoxidans DSM 771]